MARKGKRPQEGQYAPLPYSLIRSPAWRSLSGPAIKVWIELHSRYNGGNNGRLHLSLNEAAEILGIGKATAQRAFSELREKGFIVLVTKGNWYSRRAHDWGLTTKRLDTGKDRPPPTNDWHSWQPEKTKSGSEPDPSEPRKVSRQNPTLSNGSASKPVKGETALALGSVTGR